jgi:VanZ family protein
MVHFAMYTTLAFLLARAMRNPPRTTPLRVILAALLLVAAIGALDEWHQRYVQGRTTDFADWMTDSTGGLIGALVWAAAGREKKATRPA